MPLFNKHNVLFYWLLTLLQSLKFAVQKSDQGKASVVIKDAGQSHLRLFVFVFLTGEIALNQN